MFRPLLPLLLLPALAPLLMQAQAPIERRDPASREPGEPGGPIATLKLSSRLVTLAVNAVDKQGSPASGLDKSDFRLLEDGAEQKIAFFEKSSTTPLSIVLSIDGSGSLLRNERLEKEAAKKFVATLLRPQDELDLQEFSTTVSELTPFTADKQRIAEGLNHLTQGGATALYDAIYLGSQSLATTSPANGRRRVLVLITDGGDTTHTSTYTQAVEQAQRAGVIIYALIVIPIYADAGRNTGGEHALIQMTQDTGGKFFYISDAKDLAPAFEQVSEDLRTQYVLGYYAPAIPIKRRSDNLRKIEITLTDPTTAARLNLRYRTAYYATKSQP